MIGAGTESEDANGQNTLFGAGAAYIFELQANNQWMPVQKIVGTQRGVNDLFGEDAVAVSGIQVVIGAWLADTIGNDDIIDGGAVYVYERDTEITAVRNFVEDTPIYALSNPSLDGLLQIYSLDPFSSNATPMQIVSMNGNVVFHTENINEGQIDLSYLPAGVYFVTITRSGFLPQTLKWVRM